MRVFTWLLFSFVFLRGIIGNVALASVPLHEVSPPPDQNVSAILTKLDMKEDDMVIAPLRVSPLTASVPYALVATYGHQYGDSSVVALYRPEVSHASNPSSAHVPVPVILFVIGVVGLIGVARRVMNASRDAATAESRSFIPPSTPIPMIGLRSFESVEASESEMVSK